MDQSVDITTQMPEPVQGTLFEEGYLEKTSGSIVRDPDYALTELVANAWDAGATEVRLSLPENIGDKFSISDNGHGMTRQEFENRWLRLGYDRSKHQGSEVEFPPNVSGKRKAFGRNGIGRHAMFCFANGYKISTAKNGKRIEVEIAISEGQEPWERGVATEFPDQSHGTTLSCIAQRHFVDSDHVMEVLAARFFHDPMFSVFVDGTRLSLKDHPGVSDPEPLLIGSFGTAYITTIDSQRNARNNTLQGFTFRVNNRLVGEPSWTIEPYTPIDGRTAFGKRFSFLVECEFMLTDALEPDWSRFKKGPKRFELFSALNRFAIEKYRAFSLEKMDDTKKDAFAQNLDSIRTLPDNQQQEVETFVTAVVNNDPTIDTDALAKVVTSFVSLQNTRTGKSLLEKLSTFNLEDYEALERLLSEWSIRDALVVLEEVDRRLSIIKTIEILSERDDTDELHTLHPLLSESRWLFGPEFESSEYTFNQTLKNTVNAIFEVESSQEQYENWRKRPDLVVRPESSISLVGLEDFQESGIMDMRKVLLIELKKGKFSISRKEMNQGEEYVEQMRSAGYIRAKCWYDVFVVGHKVNPGILDKNLEEGGVPCAKVRAVTFGQLTQTANRRLLNLKKRLQSRYHEDPSANQSSILKELLKVPTNQLLPFGEEKLENA